jgi:hypothetical protein
MAIIAARLIETNVFPSELIVDVTEMTAVSFSLTKYFIEVRTDLNDSASADPGFSTTGISSVPSL